jgi:hypothetical protein
VSEVNRIASEFLEQYLRGNPQTELHRVVCPARKFSTVNSHDAAKEFLDQIQSQDMTERIFVSEPETVVILRTCPRRLPAFLAGIRRGKLVFTYHQHLAQVFQRDEATAVSKMLEEQGIPNYSLPSLERSSF